MDSTVLGISRLPEEIVSHVISLTTARDACVASAVCGAFLSAADSDATWHNFLPSDYASLLSQASHPVKYGSIKELYMHLYDHPLLIDGGLMSFQLERSTGAKIFMISARRLSIAADDINCDWIALPDSRFRECAVLCASCWLDISGMVNSKILTPNTAYASYLVFKVREDVQSLRPPMQTTEVAISGDTVSLHVVFVNPEWFPLHRQGKYIYPIIREDGWLELKLGTFVSGDGIDAEVTMFFREAGIWMQSGYVVQGIEVRPIPLCKIKGRNV